jgi:hypothetical protein
MHIVYGIQHKHIWRLRQEDPLSLEGVEGQPGKIKTLSLSLKDEYRLYTYLDGYMNEIKLGYLI